MSFLLANFLAIPSSQKAVLMGSSLFFMGLIAGPAPAAIQFIAPQRLRAQLSAVFLFAINFIGMTLGPLIPAMLSDGFFSGAGAIGQAMTYVVLFSCLASGFVFFFCRQDYRRLAKATSAQD